MFVRNQNLDVDKQRKNNILSFIESCSNFRISLKVGSKMKKKLTKTISILEANMEIRFEVCL